MPSYNGHTKCARTPMCSNYTKYMSQVVCMQLHASTMVFKVVFIIDTTHNTAGMVAKIIMVCEHVRIHALGIQEAAE